MAELINSSPEQSAPGPTGEELSYLAYHDSLTGLLNRKSFEDRFRENLQIAKRSRLEKNRALLFLDLDRFKDINDTFGHDVGDQVLKEVASRFQQVTRNTDQVFRLGGDEFAIVLTSLAEEIDAAIVAEKLVIEVQKPLSIDGRILQLGLSVGIVLYPRDGENAEELAKKADIALFEAKKRKNAYCFFNLRLLEKAQEKRTMTSHLHRAIEKSEFELFYQPQFDRMGNLAGCEALIRWNHPEWGSLSPLSFLPIAEETGLMVKIGHWTIREACRAITEINRSNSSKIFISVNLSLKQIQDQKLLEVIQSAVEEFHLSSEYFKLEITDAVIMEEIVIREKMDTLHRRGIALSIDDFGIGYSSLARLKTLPIEALKIDRSFVRGLPKDKVDISIVKTIITLGHEFNLQVVGEGIETEGQRDCLLSLGCDLLQGYLYSPPIPLSLFRSYMEQAAFADQPASGI
jgi:diguanylate cyclase (GGDEF)-like protein